MEIIYHEKRPNYNATIKAIPVGERVCFPYYEGMPEIATIRNLCSRLPNSLYTVNKTDNGVMVTRVE